jgi:hypothetical protein
MKEDRFEALLRDVASEYNSPPATPREEIWAGIQSRRRRGDVAIAGDPARDITAGDPACDIAAGDPRPDASAPRTGLGRYWRWGVGMAAVFALGVGLGRLAPVGNTTREPQPYAARDSQPHVSLGAQPRAADAPDATSPSLPYRIAATQHLSRTEAFLTSYRSGVRTGDITPELSAWAAELLTGTRLLLDSPAAQDPRLEQLLLDLELILAQIARLSSTGDPDGEAAMIDEALENRGTLTRIRAVVPAGPPVTGT